MAFAHDGFWQPMDTLRDKNLLEELWASGQGAVEVLGLERPWSTLISGAAGACFSPATPASRAAG
jgi:NDP-sugar pyrophosphorylase family protein